MRLKFSRLIIYLVFISLVFLQFGFARFWFGELYVPLTSFFLLAGLFILVVRFVSTGKVKSLNFYTAASFLFLLSLLVSVLGQPHPLTFRMEEFVFYLLIPVLFVNFIDDFKFIERIIWILLGCGLILSLVAFYNLLSKMSVWWLEFGGVGTRTAGAFIFECIFILILSYFLHYPNKKMTSNIFIIVSLTLLGSGILLSLSRGAWLSSFAGVGFLLIANMKGKHQRSSRIKRIVKYAFLGGAVILFLFFIVSSEVTDRITQRATIFGRGGDLVRWEVYKASLESIADHPIKGIGVGSFPEYVDVESPYGVQLLHAHNAYLNIWVEQGILGIFALGILVFFPLIKLFRLRKYFSVENEKWIIAGMTAILWVIAVHFLFESFYNFIFFWIIYGLCLAVLQLAKSRRKVEKVKK